MGSNTSGIEEHVGDLVSGYIDGELTQQQRQRVDVHCDNCQACRKELDDLKQLRRDVGQSLLSEYGEDEWRESMDGTAAKASRGIGWLLLIGGLLGIGAIVLHGFITNPTIELHMKVIIGAIYGGLAVLFISVLRQRLIERKTDKYKDVEI